LDKSAFRKLLSRVLRAVVKAMIVVIAFLVFSQFLGPLKQVYPGVIGLIETYVVVYVAFTVAGELTKGMIYHYGVNIGKAFFFIGYSIYALNKGTITETIQSVTLSVNLQIFLIMMIFIGTLDFSKSLLQMINYVADKTETEEIVLVPPEQEIPAR
jgi:hypothetical protein